MELLYLAGNGSPSPLILEDELLSLCKNIPPEELVHVLQRKPDSTDPDLQLRNSDRYGESNGMMKFILSHAAQLLRHDQILASRLPDVQACVNYFFTAPVNEPAQLTTDFQSDIAGFLKKVPEAQRTKILSAILHDKRCDSVQAGRNGFIWMYLTQAFEKQLGKETTAKFLLRLQRLNWSLLDPALESQYGDRAKEGQKTFAEIRADLRKLIRPPQDLYYEEELTKETGFINAAMCIAIADLDKPNAKRILLEEIERVRDNKDRWDDLNQLCVAVARLGVESPAFFVNCFFTATANEGSQRDFIRKFNQVPEPQRTDILSAILHDKRCDSVDSLVWGDLAGAFANKLGAETAYKFQLRFAESANGLAPWNLHNPKQAKEIQKTLLEILADLRKLIPPPV